VLVLDPHAGKAALVTPFPFSFWEQSQAFSPSSLALTLYERASYAGAPWVGTASAGPSGGVSAVDFGFPHPAAGPLVGGFAPAQWTGAVNTNESLKINATIDQVIANGGTHTSGWCLVFIEPANSGSQILSGTGPGPQGFVMDVPFGGALSLSLPFTIGGTRTVFVNTAHSIVGTWQLLQWRASATLFEVRTSNDAWQVAAYAADTFNTVNTENSILGNPFGGVIFRCLELAVGNITIPDATFDLLRAYVFSRYGLVV
jgi:hypothetical protein